jgi:hypothetical protein
MLKPLLVVILVSAISLFAQAPAPSWTLVGNTGMVQTWGCAFDYAGTMYCAANNASTGGIAKSTDHGATWTPINTGLSASCKSYRSLGMAPDGTIFTIQQACSPAHAYWLDNVNGAGTKWTDAGAVASGYGGEIGYGLAPDGVTIIAPTGSTTVLLSTDYARSWHKAANPPPTAKMAELLNAKSINGVAYLSGAIHSGTNNPCCDSTSGNIWKSTDNGNTWTPMGWPAALTGCTPSNGGCSLDAGWFVTNGIGPYLNMPTYYIGATGSKTGWYCWNGSAWNACGTNQWAGNGGQSDGGSGAATNRTQNRIIMVFYEDDGFPPIYSDDGFTWQKANSGISCSSPNCGTHGGAKIASVSIDPTTGYAYLAMKDGEIWRTTKSQDIVTNDPPVATLPQGIQQNGTGYTGTTIDTTFSMPSGTTWPVHTAIDLKNALAGSQPGDVIVLDAGATYNPADAGLGFFSLPVKSNPNNQWIYIVSSALANLPAGTRVDPTMTQYMAKIVTPNVNPAFRVAPGANHYRLAGLELTAQSNYPTGCGATGQPNCMTYFLLNTDWPNTAEPDSITIDRCYLHGSATQDLQAAIQANWSNAAVIESYVSDVHDKGFDNQAVGVFSSPGPFKIVDNYLEAAGENIMFGGWGQNSNLWVPSDIEIRNNYIYKRLDWVAPSLAGNMVVSSAIQLDSAQRVLFDSNVVQNVWAAAQLGYAMVLTVRTSLSGDLAVLNDIVVTNNVLNNVVSGFNTLAKDDQCGAAPYTSCHNAGSQTRWNITNNLILFYDPTLPGGNRNLGIGFGPGKDNINGIVGSMRDVLFRHNTMVSTSSTPCWNSVFFGAGGQTPPFSSLTSNIWLLDNVFCRQPTGDWGFQGTYGLSQYMGNPTTSPDDLTHRFYGNVMWVQPADRAQTFPAGNLAQSAGFTYQNPSILNYQLLTPYWTTTSDGQESGINYYKLLNGNSPSLDTPDY